MNTKPLPLTIVTAVLNEELLLPEFLAYAKTIAEEVIVVIDSRTKDKSIQIAKHHRCHILVDDGSSKGIVFHNKNLGIENAKHEWILILDADERLDKKLSQEISHIVLNNPQPQVKMYQTGFINFEFGRYFKNCDQKHKKFIRLFRKGSFKYNVSGTTEGFGIHAKSISKSKQILLHIPIVRSLIIKQNPEIENLKGYILHNSHPTLADFVRKINLYSRREAILLYKKNPKPSKFALCMKLITAPTVEFIYKYFVWQFYKEGAHGFIASAMYGYYRFLIIAKYYSYTMSRDTFKIASSQQQQG